MFYFAARPAAAVFHQVLPHNLPFSSPKPFWSSSLFQFVAVLCPQPNLNFSCVVFVSDLFLNFFFRPEITYGFKRLSDLWLCMWINPLDCVLELPHHQHLDHYNPSPCPVFSEHSFNSPETNIFEITTPCLSLTCF